MTRIRDAIICSFIFVQVVAEFEGETCKIHNTNQIGKCVPLNDCDYGINQIKFGQEPQYCNFINSMPRVCCPRNTKPAPGQKSENYCLFYYPKSPIVPVVVGGEYVLPREFPHMAILGYGGENDIRWYCGGSLISEEFVLTAAHCIKHQQWGTVSWVRLGDLDIATDNDDAKPQNFSVQFTFVYPSYRSISHYHDIALIKLDRPVKFDKYIKPACLHSEKNLPSKLIATGWGQTDFFGERSTHLLKVILDHVSFKRCASIYANAGRKLRNGIIDDMQICAGGIEGRDTCLGDSGGPLQFIDSRPTSNFYVVGITSFGKACGFGNSVGVYTRVSKYIQWIEDIVWPSEA